MSDRLSCETTRRAFLRRLLLGGAALAALPVLEACSSPAAAPAKPADAPKPAESKPAAPAAQPAATAGSSGQAAPASKPGAAPDGDEAALIEASKKEGKFVWYTPTVEEDLVKFLAMFKDKYPWVDVSEYLRLQTGKLYAKLEPEMQQGVQSADVTTLTEIALAIDFQKKGFWGEYQSPMLKNYDKKWKSNPEGLWLSPWINIAGIAWNPNKVPAAEAPKTYLDLLNNPKWANGQICFKDSASGLQYSQWAMIVDLHGEQFWDKMTALKPVGLAGTAQQYEKVVAGEILINGMGQTSTYVQQKLAGAPIEIALPKEGVPYTVQCTGLVKNAPHPATAKLFLNWLFGPEGQKAITTTSQDPVTSTGGPYPQLTPPMSELNVWVPKDMEKYIAEQPAWREKWNKITGV
ncbi:MAG: extracellular solute-binding protein [Chloroflexota bacterium]